MGQSSQVVRVGLVQMQCGSDLDANVARACQCIRTAAAKGAQIVCLQELFRAPYFCQKQDPSLFDLAEPIPGPTTAILAETARSCGCVVIGSIFEKRAPGLFHNTAVHLDVDGELLGTYRKMHIPDDPLYFEKYYFAPGDQGFRAHKTRFGTIGTLVCWDQWYPEGARATALRGAQILLYPTAIGWHPKEKAEFGEAQREAWEIMHRAHAIANGVYVVAVNRVGHEGGADRNSGLEFWGNSLVIDPFGRVLGRGANDREETLVVDCDLARIEETRRNWPFLRDRRIDAYGDLVKRFADGSA